MIAKSGASAKSEQKIPGDLSKALSSLPAAKAKWRELTPIARRDFVRWVESARQPDTRKRRVERTCDMLRSGKRRPCCYAVVPMNLYKALGENPKAKERWKTLTPDERRDFVSLIDYSDKSEAQAKVEKICQMLVSGKRHP